MLEASLRRNAPFWLDISSAGAITPAGVAASDSSAGAATDETCQTAGFGKHQDMCACLAHIDQVIRDGELIGCNN